MSLPNLSRAVKKWQQSIVWKQETQQIDASTGIAKRSSVDVNIKATVQPASREILQTIGITDFSLERLWIHGNYDFKINDIIEYKTKSYKVINVDTAYIAYGFVDAICEIIKNTGKL